MADQVHLHRRMNVSYKPTRELQQASIRPRGKICTTLVMFNDLSEYFSDQNINFSKLTVVLGLMLLHTHTSIAHKKIIGQNLMPFVMQTVVQFLNNSLEFSV